MGPSYKWVEITPINCFFWPQSYRFMPFIRAHPSCRTGPFDWPTALAARRKSHQQEAFQWKRWKMLVSTVNLPPLKIKIPKMMPYLKGHTFSNRSFLESMSQVFGGVFITKTSLCMICAICTIMSYVFYVMIWSDMIYAVSYMPYDIWCMVCDIWIYYTGISYILYMIL